MLGDHCLHINHEMISSAFKHGEEWSWKSVVPYVLEFSSWVIAAGSAQHFY
jgi:hypothetical protein